MKVVELIVMILTFYIFYGILVDAQIGTLPSESSLRRQKMSGTDERRDNMWFSYIALFLAGIGICCCLTPIPGIILSVMAMNNAVSPKESLWAKIALFSNIGVSAVILVIYGFIFMMGGFSNI